LESIDTSVPVVVIRCARHGGLGITRTLGRWGVPVYNIDESKRAPAFYSKYSSGKFTWDAEQSPVEETIGFLKHVADKIGKRPLLIPTSDGTAMMVADHADVLAEWYDFPRVDPDLVRSFASKREMYFLAKKHGLTTAETLFPQSRDELAECLDKVRFPVMAKGIFGIELERKCGKRMTVVNDRAEAVDFFDRFEDWTRPNIMLQEYIPGDAETCWMIDAYFDRNSDCLLAFTGRKIRQYPAYTGLTSLGECVHNETVVRSTCDFMKRCGYRGVLDMGYRFDARDGQYKAIDINPRVGASFRLFLGTNRMDVVRALYLDMTGQRVERAPVKEGRRWLVEDCDLVSSVRYFRDNKLAFKEWLLSHRGVEETGIFAMDDLMPVMWMGLRDLGMLWDMKFGSRSQRDALT
jgi:D-aspartate ligase